MTRFDLGQVVQLLRQLGQGIGLRRNLIEQLQRIGIVGDDAHFECVGQQPNRS